MELALKRRIFWIAGAALLGALGIGAYFVNQIVLVGAAYHAKMLCSGIFVAGRDATTVEREDIAANQHPVLRIIRARIDRQQRTVSAGVFGLPQRRAVFRDGLGCTLAIGISADELRNDPVTMVMPPARASAQLWPAGDAVELQRLPRAINAAALQAAVATAFTEPDPKHARRTRALIVVYDGRIVAEHYAPGFSTETAQIGWSMSKSVTGALIGVLTGDGKLALAQPAPVPEWRQAGDVRAAITLDHLLHMTSGLAFNEDYGNATSDVVQMLFATPDMAAYAAAKPLAATPGTLWHYSTGTSVILARIVTRLAGDTLAAQRSFPRRALFDRLGMRSAVFELDPAGTFAGASFLYASARDWARFGLLYQRDGIWNGERLLPQGWVRYSLTPTPEATDFGAHLWRKVPRPYYRQNGARPTLPTDTFHIVGHHAQFISVIPSRKLVVVRLGLSGAWSWDQEQLLEQLLDAVPLR